jgi:hypothetical protein
VRIVASRIKTVIEAVGVQNYVYGEDDSRQK